MSDGRIEALQARIERMERQARWRMRGMSAATLAALLLAAGALTAGKGAAPAAAGLQSGVLDEIRTRRLVVVDDAGTMRVRIGMDDASDEKRKFRVAGMTIYDGKGDERGGIATAHDGSAVIALDAPVGVGSAMRDRIGMKVDPDGDAALMVITNRAGLAAVLGAKDDQGTLELARADVPNGRFEVRALRPDGDRSRTEPMDASQKRPAANPAQGANERR